MSNLNFNNMFGNTSIDFECPKCNNTIAITLNQAGSTVVCPACNVSIKLEKDDSFDDSISDVNYSLNELSNTLKNFGK